MRSELIGVAHEHEDVGQVLRMAFRPPPPYFADLPIELQLLIEKLD